MQARMRNPAVVIPDAMKPLVQLGKLVRTAGVEQSTVALVHLRVSQINGCSVCVDGDSRTADKDGVDYEKRATVAAWRHAPYFTDAERAALALAEAATRLADSADPVPDEIWEAAGKHFGEQELAAIILTIGIANLYNRLNVITGQIAGPQPWE
jgi:AhpD family alkylhydroperoxidase